MNNLAFIPSDTPPSEGLQPLDPGQYVFTIVEAEVAPNKNADGKNLHLKYEAAETHHILEEWLAVENPNEQAENIARGKLAAICQKHLGLQGIPKASKMLLGKQIILKLALEDNTYKNKIGETVTNKKNVIKGYALAPAQARKIAAAPQAEAKPPVRKQVKPVEDAVDPAFDNEDDELPF